LLDELLKELDDFDELELILLEERLLEDDLLEDDDLLLDEK